MTTVATVIGEDTVSADVLEMDIWVKDLGVGHWRVLIKNLGDVWGGDFHSNDAVTLTIDTIDMMKGYLDDSINALNDKGVYTNEIEATGRDYGRDLARLKYSGDYVDTLADDLMDAILTAKGSEITYLTNPSTAPIVNIGRSRTYLIDWLGTIAKRIDYSAYVDILKAFHFFAVGAVAEESGVALASIAGAVDNNILDLKKGEELGVSIANKIELTAGSLKDHYTDGTGTPSAIITGAYTECAVDVNNGFGKGILTADGGTPFAIFEDGEEIIISNSENGNEGRYTIFSVGDTVLMTTGVIAGIDNADDETIIISPQGNWIPGADCNVANESTVKRVGISSIKFFNTVAATPQITLDFTDTLFSRSALDLSNPDEMSFYIRHNNAGEEVLIQPQLTDNVGNVIEFYRGSNSDTDSGKGRTLNVPADEDHKISMNIGANITLSTGPVYTNRWYNIVGGAFDWENVVKLTIKATQRNPLPPPITIDLAATTLYLDDLCIPSVEVIALVEDAVSVAAYGVSEWWDQRDDIKSIVELEVIAVKELANRKDPLQTIRVIASGQTDSKYAGQSLTVQAPDHGIAAATKYRIVDLHHQVRKDARKGYEFITTYNLVKHTINPVQVIDPLRFELATDPRGAMIELINLTRRRARSAQPTERNDFGDTHPVLTVFYSSSGAAFPEDPDDGFLFLLTSDIAGPPVYYGDEGINYEYSATTDTWIRGPVLLRRAAEPPAGGEVTGDIWHNTATDILYEWTGAAWGQIASLNIADNPDFGTVEWPTDQLAIEMRPWTGNFSVIWDDKDDEPPTDWNHFKWGQRDQENVADATIKYADGTTVDINHGQNINVNDGERFVYWDKNFKTGGNYDVQWTTNYSNASGVGKGLLAVVQIRNAASESPSIMLYNTYIPQMGVGSLVAHSIYSKHISGDFITGKNIRTGAGVQWAAGGNSGVVITSTGLRGKGAAGAIMVELLAANGYITAAGGAVRLDNDGINIISDSDVNFILFRKVSEAIKGAIYKDTNDYMVIHSTDARIRMRGDVVPIVDGGFDLGLASLEWAEIRGEKLLSTVRVRLPVGNNMYG